MAKILDACCGSRMFWFDRNNPDVIFADNRKLETTLCDGRTLVIEPLFGDRRGKTRWLCFMKGARENEA